MAGSFHEAMTPKVSTQAVEDAYTEKVKEILGQYFTNALTDPDALEALLRGLDAYATARAHLLERLK
jgi:hypothetical protein